MNHPSTLTIAGRGRDTRFQPGNQWGNVLALLGALASRLTPEERAMLDAMTAELAEQSGLPRLRCPPGAPPMT
jgi:hypothetical protein